MSIEKVRGYFRALGIEEKIKEFSVSSATVALAAEALGVEEARIAKSLTFKIEDRTILIVAAGDAKVDNARYKAAFGGKAKMLTAEEAVERVGHAVGGVCPFGALPPCFPPPAAPTAPWSSPVRSWSGTRRRTGGWMCASSGGQRRRRHEGPPRRGPAP